MFTCYSVVGYNQQLINKQTKTSNVMRLLQNSCCSGNCLQSFKCGDVKRMRMKFWCKQSKERKQWIFDKFSEQGNIDKSMQFLTERGVKVCQNAFMIIYGINKSVYYRQRRRFIQGVTSPSNHRFRQRTTKYLSAMNWFENYFSFHGDRMPDCNILFLPYRTRKFVLFKQYKNELGLQNDLKRSTFYRMWRASFPNVKIKEVRMSTTNHD